MFDRLSSLVAALTLVAVAAIFAALVGGDLASIAILVLAGRSARSLFMARSRRPPQRRLPPPLRSPPNRRCCCAIPISPAGPIRSANRCWG